MSLQIVYSFDHIQTGDLISLPRVVSSSGCTVSSSAGRDGTGALVTSGLFNAAFVTALENPDSKVTIGCWIVIQSNATNPTLGLGHPDVSDTNNPFQPHTTLVPQNDGSIAVFKSYPVLGTKLGQTVGGVFTFGVPFYLEWQSQIGSSGSSIIRINEVEVLHLNTINNSGASSNLVSTVVFYSECACRFDDVYILTGTNNGDGWTDFKGIVTIIARLANGVGGLTQWTPSAPTGVNWDNVNEDIPNSVDFNDAPTSGLIDLYQLEDVSFDPIAVQVDLYLKKLDAGPSSVSNVLRIGGVDNVSSDIIALTTSFKYYKKVYTTQPGGSPWTQIVYNALQAGPKRVV